MATVGVVYLVNVTGKICWIIAGIHSSLRFFELLGHDFTNLLDDDLDRFEGHYKMWAKTKKGTLVNPTDGVNTLVHEFFDDHFDILRTEQAIELFFEALIGTEDLPGLEIFGLFQQQIMERIYTPQCPGCSKQEINSLGHRNRQNMFLVMMPDKKQDPNEDLQSLVDATFAGDFESNCQDCHHEIVKRRTVLWTNPNEGLLLSLQRTRQANFRGNFVKSNPVF